MAAIVAACADRPETGGGTGGETAAVAESTPLTPGVRALARIQPGDDTVAPPTDTAAVVRTPTSRGTCEGGGGMDPGLAGRPDSIAPDQLLAYVAGLCFGNAPASGADSAEAEQGPHPVHGTLLLFMPETRMLAFDPDSLRPGRGAVVAAVENYDRDSLQLQAWGTARLRPGQEGYLRFGRRADSTRYAVFFKFVQNDSTAPLRYAQIAEGTWEHQPDSTYGLRARWNHPGPATTGRATPPAPSRSFVRPAYAADVPAPAARLLLSVTLQRVGGGWISCLRGCCKTSGVFVN
jgi:hypothetical protein